MTERGKLLASELEKLYPGDACTLKWDRDPWHLLVMGRLSAQCTDERVNEVCRTLFVKYPDAASMAECDIRELEEAIRPCGLFRGKASSLAATAKIIVEKYGGRIPGSMDELTALPGIGRKIANLLLGDVYGIPGIVADTHCIRICGRLGFYPAGMKDPLKTEKIMEKEIPPEAQSATCHRLVDFGRDVCRARSPLCGDCPAALRSMCVYRSDR